MKSRSFSLRLALASVVVVASCQEADPPFAPEVDGPASVVVPHAPGQIVAWFNRASPEVLDIAQTVFAGVDAASGALVVGIENPGIARAVENALKRHGVPASAYRLQLSEPIQFAATLRERHRPTIGGLQIHFGNYLCTLGFNADHSGGASFITNSHCTNQQGGTEGTLYYQPVSSVDPTSIAVEAADPNYTSCGSGRVCRYSDASRALYHNSATGSRGYIAKTGGVNSGSLNVTGQFTITSQNNSTTQYSGTIHKVGRTTGWTSGTVTSSCASVNVSNSNVRLLCQTLVQRSGTTIVGGGDSGSPAFRVTSGDNVELVGILWGGSSSGDMFVFSPLKNIQDELGSLTVTAQSGGGGTNDPPTASFTRSCNGLSCTFNGSGSSDDGTIVNYAWNFGDNTSGSGVSTSHTYAAGGTYTVTLTVTDNGGLTDAQSQSVSVSSPSGGNITLTATGSKVKGRKTANLSWSGATSTQVDVRRDGNVVATTANDGAHTDSIGKGGGSHTYQICEAGTSTCSNTVTLNF